MRPRIMQYHKAGVMNSTEKAYAYLLDLQKANGTIQKYYFESMKLSIGKNCGYTPDFMVVNSSGELEFHEVKGGFWRDDARVKIKACADKYPFIFKGYTLKSGKWIEEDFTVR